MQHFVDGFVTQCRRHDLRAELVLVEWNPPADRRPLIEELKWPSELGPCEIRIITVPREVHAQIPHGDSLPLFQMIAKNVGIRRARGQFVLATNIDILFSDEVMLFMRDKLQTGYLFRADRCDVPTEVPAGVPFGEVLAFCREQTFRIHATGFILVKQPNGKWRPSSPLAAMLGIIWKGVVKRTGMVVMDIGRFVGLGGGAPASTPWRPGAGVLRVAKWIYHALLKRELFMNACGDYTLLSKEDWASLRGYPEWPMYSLHLDSILVYQAHRSGIKEVYLGKDARIYHIEHEPGSGFTPDSSDKLFARLEARGIPCLDWERDVESVFKQMDRDTAAGRKITYNGEDWGYASVDFEEVSPGAIKKETVDP